MAFRYRCVDEDGVFYDGVTPHPSEEAARQEFEGRGWQVLRLEKLDKPKKKRKKGRRKREREHSDAPSLISKIPLPVRLTLVALVSFALSSYQRVHRPEPPPAEATPSTIQVVVTGKLPGSVPVKRVTVHFPDIPYQVTHTPKEVGLDSEGRFKAQVSFQSFKSPGRVLVVAEDQQQHLLQSQGAAWSGEPTLDVGKLAPK